MVARAAGFARSASLTRCTMATSAGSTTPTVPAPLQVAMTVVTSEPLAATWAVGSTPLTVTRRLSNPTSSWASRRAVSTIVSSVFSARPPGRATCPAWCRKDSGRRVRTMSFLSSLIRASTAEDRPPPGRRPTEKSGSSRPRLAMRALKWLTASS